MTFFVNKTRSSEYDFPKGKIMMKKKTLIAFAGISLLLSGCQNPVAGIFTDKEVNVYSLVSLMAMAKKINMQDPAAVAEASLKGATTFKIHKDYPNILYADFKTYCKLLTQNLTEEYTVTVNDDSISVNRGKNGTVFSADVNTERKEFRISGSLSLDSIGLDASSIVGSLMTDMKLDQGMAIEPQANAKTLSYARFAKDLPVYAENGSLIAPLGLFDAAFGPNVGAYHAFDSERLLQHNNFMALAMPVGEAGNSWMASMQRSYEKKGMPLDMRILDKASLYFTMDHHYGLQDHRKIRSMSDYFDNHGFGESLIAENADERCNAYFEVFADLQDDHSGIVTLASWYGDNESHSHRGQRSNERRTIGKGLMEQRNAAFGTERSQYGFDNQVHYSSSGKTAFFYFDSFSFDVNPYDPAKRDQLYETDSYFNFIHEFEEIKKHPEVEHVIIDDSCNGGGTVGIAAKLLALISKDNNGGVYMYDRMSKGVSKMFCQVDSNQDGVYDKDDVYGDDYDISILTSPYSFSCGNLLPWYAQRNGFAKVIGQNSGGGECSVASGYLPSGRGIQYSSNSILCDVVGGKIVRGVELGAKPDIEIPYYQFYDLDVIEAKLTAKAE